MTANSLHLDAFYHFTSRIAEYGYLYNPAEAVVLEPLDSCCATLKREVWCRITIIVQMVLIFAENTVKQGIRAATFIISGVLRLDSKRLKIGAIDFISMVVQIVALPVLGLVAIFSPTKAGNVAFKVAQMFNPQWNTDTNNQIFEKPSVRILEWAVLPAQAAISSLSRIVQEILSLNPLQAGKQVGYLILSPFSIFSFLPTECLHQFRGYEVKNPNTPSRKEST